MELRELKKKLRNFKKQEIKIRFRYREYNDKYYLVWNDFFSTKEGSNPRVKYDLDQLLRMNHEQRKEAFGDYFYNVFFQYYKENGLSLTNMYDPSILSLIGLPPHANQQDIKNKFRKLAKKYHPDNGGDPGKFIELIEAYEQLNL